MLACVVDNDVDEEEEAEVVDDDGDGGGQPFMMVWPNSSLILGSP